MTVDTDVVVIGARRWGKLMISELCSIFPQSWPVYLQHDEDPRSDDMADCMAWLRSQNLSQRVSMISGNKFQQLNINSLAVIANSAYKHAATIKTALNAGFDILSEKPISYELSTTAGILDSAELAGRTIMCTNTYLFADYLDRLKREHLSNHPITQIQLEWNDPASELRYGQRKSYDSSVPLIIDVLPHVGSILFAILGEFEPQLSGMNVHLAGSSINLEYLCNAIRVSVSLERNGKARARRLKFISDSKNELVFDFTTEPGFILTSDKPATCIDPDWQQRRKPIASMFDCVYRFYQCNLFDSRLDSTAALIGNRLIDLAIHPYVQSQVRSIQSYLRHPDGSQVPQFVYALKEAYAISTRCLPYLNLNSPLHELAAIAKQDDFKRCWEQFNI